MKNLILLSAIIMISLPFPSLPLMGQTAARIEVQAVKPIEETRPGKPLAQEPGEAPEPGKLQLRAAARPWPDSTVTFTAAGERQSKSVYMYDAAGNQTLYESYSREGNTWVNSSKSVYTYDAAGNRTLSESYRWAGGAWVNSSKSVFAYDASGNQTLSESYRWENNRWTGEGRLKLTFAYDNRGVRILQVVYNWTNNTWVESYENHYDRKTVNSNVYPYVCVNYNEDGIISGTALFIAVADIGHGTTFFIPEDLKMEYTATYDANDNLTQVETTVLRDGKRVPYQRYVLKYSNNNSVSIEEYYIENNSNQMEFKSTNTFDARENLTLSESYWWDYSFQEWIGDVKQIHTYDANGRELSSEYYNWDTSSGGWRGNDKSVYTYDANGRELSSEYYDWDTSSGGWQGSGKTTYEERNEYGDVMLYKSYLWKNGGWEWTSYTVSYPGVSDPSGTEYVGDAEPSVYIYGDMLQIRTVSAERIGVHTLDGAKVYESAVPSGTTTVSVGWLPKGVLIVRGSSGWAKKVLIR